MFVLLPEKPNSDADDGLHGLKWQGGAQKVTKATSASSESSSAPGASVAEGRHAHGAAAAARTDIGASQPCFLSAFASILSLPTLLPNPATVKDTNEKDEGTNADLSAGSGLCDGAQNAVTALRGGLAAAPGPSIKEQPQCAPQATPSSSGELVSEYLTPPAPEAVGTDGSRSDDLFFMLDTPNVTGRSVRRRRKLENVVADDGDDDDSFSSPTLKNFQ